MPESALAELEKPIDIPTSNGGALWELPEITGIQPLEKTEVVTEEPVKEKPPEQKALEPKTEEAPELKNMTPKARENFARVEEARKKDQETHKAELEKLRSETKAEIEAREAKIREYEELIKKPAVAPEEIQKRDQEIQNLRNEVRLASLERDPDFVSRYVAPKNQLAASLKDMAAASTAPEAFDRAFRMGDQDKLDEIRDSLPANQQRRWDATLLQMEQVDIQKDIALKNWSQTADQIQQERNQRIEETVRQRYTQNLQIARQVAAEPFEKIPVLKDDLELKQELQSVLTAIAGGEGADDWDPHKIMQRVAASYVQNKMIQKQREESQAQAKTIEDQAKKIEDLESFVRSKYGSLPNTQVTTETKKDEGPVALWDQISSQQTNGGSSMGHDKFI